MNHVCTICGDETEFGSFTDIGFVCGKCWQRSWVYALKKAYEEEEGKRKKSRGLIKP